MNNETYESLVNHIELYEQIKSGLEDIENGNTKPFDEAILHLREKVLQAEQERIDGVKTISVIEA